MNDSFLPGLDSPRGLFAWIFFFCSGLLGFAVIYIQGIQQLDPCPLCVVQRIAYIVCALLALVGMLMASGLASRIVALLLGMSALLGTAVASHQLWLIYYGDPFSCEVSLEEQLLAASPLAQWWPLMFDASGSCIDASAIFIGLPIAVWSLLAFVGIALMSVMIARKR